MTYIPAAQRIGGDLTAGHLFPVVTTDGGQGRLSCRSPYEGEPATRYADGKAAGPLHDARISSESTHASELPLS